MLGLEGQKAWVEDPGFPFTRKGLELARLSLAPVPVDADGIDVGYGMRRFPDAKLVVVTPGQQAPLDFLVGSQPNAVAVGDVNGDGKPDLVVANYGTNTVSVLLGNGNGTFQAQTTFATDSRPRSVTVADVNGDGKPDLVVANFLGSDVSVPRPA